MHLFDPNAPKYVIFICIRSIFNLLLQQKIWINSEKRGHIVPSFYYNHQVILSIVDLKQHIGALVEAQLTPEEFIVEVAISGERAAKKVLILLDADSGISIDRCAEVSRKVAHTLEEEDAIDNAYVLEVSSPGLDYPLSSLRQYKKNIGRSVKVTLLNEEQKKGELLEVTADHIVIREKIKEKGSKKMKEQDTNVPYENIKKTNVLVSFK